MDYFNAGNIQSIDHTHRLIGHDEQVFIDGDDLLLELSNQILNMEKGYSEYYGSSTGKKAVIRALGDLKLKLSEYIESERVTN